MRYSVTAWAIPSVADRTPTTRRAYPARPSGEDRCGPHQSAWAYRWSRSVSEDRAAARDQPLPRLATTFSAQRPGAGQGRDRGLRARPGRPRMGDCGRQHRPPCPGASKRLCTNTSGLPVLALGIGAVLAAGSARLGCCSLSLLRYHEKRDVPDTAAAPTPMWCGRFATTRTTGSRTRWWRWASSSRAVFRQLTTDRHPAHRPTTPAATSTTADPVGAEHDSLRALGAARRRSRLFFSSNYDGSLESYMNDFIDKAAWGLNAIFSNGDGFPRTSFLFCGGITDEKAYKRFLPTRQVQSRVWYSAYPHLTTKNIANNAAIRKGLSRADERRRDADAGCADSASATSCRSPAGGAHLDGIPWDRLCRRCK